MLKFYGDMITQQVLHLNTLTKPMSERSTYERAFLQIMNLWTKDEICREFVFSKRLARMAAELMGVKGAPHIPRSGALQGSGRWLYAMARGSILLATKQREHLHGLDTLATHAADTVSKIIHKRCRKAPDEPCSEPAPVVNNFATKEMDIVNNLPPRHVGSERKAPRPVRSTAAIPSRVSCRTPAGSRVPVRRSERTTSREDPCISSTSDKACASAQTPSTGKQK